MHVPHDPPPSKKIITILYVIKARIDSRVTVGPVENTEEVWKDIWAFIPEWIELFNSNAPQITLIRADGNHKSRPLKKKKKKKV